MAIGRLIVGFSVKHVLSVLNTISVPTCVIKLLGSTSSLLLCGFTPGRGHTHWKLVQVCVTFKIPFSGNFLLP